MKLLLCTLATLSLSAASYVSNETSVGASCTINSYNDVNSVVSSCKTITVGSFEVPAGATLKLALQYGTVLTFNGVITFGYTEWDGPLMWIIGDGVTVQGSSSHLINGRGSLWWDGYGDHSNKKKPKTMIIQATGNSVFKSIKIKDCPHTCIGITDSHDMTIENWNIDCKDGDSQGGANTDGFDISRSYKITIKDTVVWNQDDCICINQGQHLMISNMQCTGSHGLSIAVGLYQDYADNTVHNVTFKNSVVQNSKLGLHIKTIAGNQKGEISSVTYNNIKLSGISSYGINIQQDYTNDGSTGNPKGNIVIKDLTLTNIYGTLSGTYSTAIYVLCGSGGCSNWHWSGINLQGASQPNSCNYAPSGFTC
ncbi:polygalacturonase-like [Diorhabda carinulata]|uniref:polygalacturonase-like n=1 Tax=Diorhabda sublineata TaxID=1163346 RepID=UPI0024E1724C|nr:polygalacturonase-like [Diorhabda sublineata]XP_057668416.1 polygalacturonase-like [Diorhabda carinulata]